ncbi:MAG: hypothetical protein VX910_12780 [Candidatus Latescibacterota bacterium]|nr:hypothetical protein [Candidatus Latescibacterota bacterium]
MNKDQRLLLIVLGAFTLVNGVLIAGGHIPVDTQGIGLIIAAGVSLALYSFLYGDNPVFKLVEHAYVGVVAAYEFSQVWYQNILSDIINPLTGHTENPEPIWSIVIPTILGFFLLVRLVGKAAWLSRLSFGLIVGLGAGLLIPRRISAYLIQQIEPTVGAVFTSAGFDFNSAFILLGVVSVLVYFSFSLEHKGVVGGVSRVGIWFLMVSFGASFGYTVMARLSLLIGQLTFLMQDWLHLPLPLF